MLVKNQKTLFFSTAVLIFMLGLTHIFFLPPWEGFDEFAHWSSISQIAKGHGVPVYGESFIDQSIENFPGPFPYTSVPPFENNNHTTYNSYIYDDQKNIFNQKPNLIFKKGKQLNWQAQHPPLFYFILAAPFKSVEQSSWAINILTLRIFSWIIAFLGLAIGAYATLLYIPKYGPYAAYFTLSWPLFVPQFFPEMARLGNDSLCLFIFSLIWWVLIKNGRKLYKQRTSVIGLGMLIGLGLLTKAFYLPILLGVSLFFLYMWFKNKTKPWWKALMTMNLVAIIFGGWWYVYKALYFGTITGSEEMVKFTQQGGQFLPSLINNFSFFEFLRGIAAFMATFSMVGTWSLVRLPEYFILGVVCFVLWTSFRWVLSYKRLPDSLQLPLFIISPMLLGLVYHVLTRLAISGRGIGTPGWYLHILMPAMAAALAIGFKGSVISYLLGIYSIIMGLINWTLQISLYSGCAVKLGANKNYQWLENSCFINLEQMSRYSYPYLGIITLLISVSLLIFIIFRFKSELVHILKMNTSP